MMNSNFDLFGDFAALSNFHHAGVIVLWWVGVEKIMCEVKDI